MATAGICRILVVDDDVSFVTFVCAALEKLAVQPQVALTGEEAGRRLVVPFSGVLLDLNLPDMSGLEVLRIMRLNSDRTPVVVLTGAATVGTAVEAMKLGAVDLLEKPVRLPELSEVVRHLAAFDRGRDAAAEQPVERLVVALAQVVRHQADVPTVREWATVIGRSESSLYALCEINGVAAKAALDLARLLRVNRSTYHFRFGGLSHADPRTIERLLRRSGLTEEAVSDCSLIELLARQRLIRDDGLLRRLARLVSE